MYISTLLTCNRAPFLEGLARTPFFRFLSVVEFSVTNSSVLVLEKTHCNAIEAAKLRSSVYKSFQCRSGVV